MSSTVATPSTPSPLESTPLAPTDSPCDPSPALAGAGAGNFPKPKVTVHFSAVGSAMRLRQNVCKISSTQRFEAVVAYLRKMLRVGPSEHLFLYVNSSFAPALDEVVGNLHRCFKNSNDHLVVTYSMTPAFG